MKELKRKTAFVTGAASGIGLGIARALARASVNVVLADLEKEPLEKATQEISGMGVKAGAFLVDVADRARMYETADRVEEAFGDIHILVNNAGIGFAGTTLDEIDDKDYDWVIGVNLYGVIHGTKAFVPKIKKHGGEGHVVNTASISGLRVTRGWKHGLYSTTKFAVVAFSEGLRDDLEPFGIGVSVLCPAAVKTNVYQAGRNRPLKFGGAFERPKDHPLFKVSQIGIEPDLVGDLVLTAIKNNELYIITHPDTRDQVEQRHKEIAKAYDLADQRAGV
ncbi:MAG: SDR family NAD(P)-dependent oxidoreductase [Proteobacteria bacterium]|nr:SDR family NAD(P)-dependent oxidoreductase [Pseudomonadota bacterium]